MSTVVIQRFTKSHPNKTAASQAESTMASNSSSSAGDHQPGLGHHPREHQHRLSITPPTEHLDYRQISAATRRPSEGLSRTTLKVVHELFTGDLSRLRSDTIADDLRISPTTRRRRLRADQVCYQELLDCVRQYRCEKLLGQGWLPGKTLAWDLGYAEVNSFYRAFKRWTGFNYSDIKTRFI